MDEMEIFRISRRHYEIIVSISGMKSPIYCKIQEPYATPNLLNGTHFFSPSPIITIIKYPIMMRRRHHQLLEQSTVQRWLLLCAVRGEVMLLPVGGLALGAIKSCLLFNTCQQSISRHVWEQPLPISDTKYSER